MIRGKTRHQLFLPDDTSRRLAAMAKSQKRARSDLLVEMVDAWMNKRATSQTDERVLAKLDRIARAVEIGNREAYIISNSIYVFTRFHLNFLSAQPTPGEEAKALAQSRFAEFQQSVARALSRTQPSPQPIPEVDNGEVE